MTPTPDQAAYLKAIYKHYSRYHLAKKMGITEKDLDGMLRYLGLKKKQPPLTEDQETFIKDNFYKMKHSEIAKELGVTDSRVQNYCFRHNLKKTGKHKFIPPPKEIIRFDPPVEVKHEKPPATYSAGRENTIDKYLKKEI